MVAADEQAEQTMKQYESWGRYPRVEHKAIRQLHSREAVPEVIRTADESVLPFAYGRSYGDSCLNDGGVLLDVTGLDKFIAFDRENGILRVEAGVSVEEILKVIIPAGWFVPVSPGTKYVSVGGAIANDVHGKNHHVAGTFGCHVTQFELLRSDGERLLCSPTENEGYYRATIGGLGLTGIITWAEMQLKAIPTALIDQESIRFGHMDEFFDINEESHEFPYTVAWVDCMAQGKHLGRGLYQRGDFYDPPAGTDRTLKDGLNITVPFTFPVNPVIPATVRMFNELYYRKQLKKVQRAVTHYNPFFYPLDAINEWYRGYGPKGFLQYQFVMPYKESREPIREMFRQIAASQQGSPLVVFKTFGDIESPGMLSFPRPGVTLAMDFPFKGQETLDLLDRLDRLVFDNGGALYPAKDARMSPESFRRSYPNWEEFAQYVDPGFSSSFWRRVAE